MRVSRTSRGVVGHIYSEVIGSRMRKGSLEWGEGIKYGEKVCVAGRWQGQSVDED